MKTFAFTVTDKDVRNGEPGLPSKCALALAIKRAAYERIPNRNIVVRVHELDTFLWIENPEGSQSRRIPLINSRAMDRFQRQFDAGNITYLEEPLHFRPRQRWT